MQANLSSLGKTRMNVRRMVFLAMLSTIAYIVMVVGRIPVVSFLKYDPKDVIIIFGGFLFGPLSAFAISLVVSLVEMFTVSDTGVIGLVMNVLSTCAFACTASYFYKKRKTLRSAVIGLIFGCLLMTAMMLLWNYLITPLYLHVPREDVVAMLVPVFLPFNLLKSGINAALSLLLYKPLVNALRGIHILPESEGGTPPSGRANIGVMLVSALVLITCILVILVFRGLI